MTLRVPAGPYARPRVLNARPSHDADCMKREEIAQARARVSLRNCLGAAGGALVYNLTPTSSKCRSKSAGS
jgi:hypothetical protein